MDMKYLAFCVGAYLHNGFLGAHFENEVRARKPDRMHLQGSQFVPMVKKHFELMKNVYNTRG